MRLLLVMCLVVTASIALRAQQPAAPATPRQRDPPTLRVASFSPTNNRCQ